MRASKYFLHSAQIELKRQSLSVLFTRRLALESTDPLTREWLDQMIEELEFQLQDQRKSRAQQTVVLGSPGLRHSPGTPGTR